jgi:hypothetical protein
MDSHHKGLLCFVSIVGLVAVLFAAADVGKVRAEADAKVMVERIKACTGAGGQMVPAVVNLESMNRGYSPELGMVCHVSPTCGGVCVTTPLETSRPGSPFRQ